MYRYSQQIRSNPGTQTWRKRIINIIILILVVVAILFAVLFSKASIREERFNSYYEKQIMFEIGQATSQMNTLSRTGGSGTSNLLGKIRQRIYAIEVLQAQHEAVYGVKKGERVESESFQGVYAILDQFDEKLTGGKTIKDVQTQLNESINALRDHLATLYVKE